MRVTRVFAAVLGTVGCLVASVASAAVRGEVPQRLDREFPLLAAALDTAVADSTVRVTSGARFHEPVVLESASQRVVLRALDAAPAKRQMDGDGSSYHRAFRGADVLRTTRNGASYEVLFADNRAAIDAASYKIASMKGVSAVVPYGRSVRFLSDRAGSPGSDITLTAPVVVGADGRASQVGRWVVKNAGSAAASVKLEIDDPMLRYPVAVAWSHGSAARAKSAIGHIAKRTPSTLATGSITGFVSDQSGSPLAFQSVDVYRDSDGEYVGTGYSDENGNYVLGDLETGTYKALIISFEYASEMYNDVACNGICDLNAATAINVVDGANTPNINFALTRLTSAGISGTVNDTDQRLLEGVTVAVYDATGSVVATDDTDETGAYEVSLNDAGTYFAATLNNAYPGLVDQLYSGTDCTGCDVTAGTGISVSAGAVTAGVDFTLKTNGGAISGAVTDSGAGAPIVRAEVLVYNSLGRLVTFGYSDDAGNYSTYHGLAAGDYYAVASAHGFGTELYDNVACEGCVPTTGTAIAVTLGATSTGVDFSLPGVLARARGTVTDETTQQALGGVWVYFYDANGEPVIAAESSFEDGTYEARLPAGGTYYARTFNVVHEGYGDEAYGGAPCTSCDVVATSAPIEVAAGTVATGIDFQLAQTGGWISGKVLDTNNAAIANSYVIIYAADGSTVSYGIPDANGNYTIFNRIDTGTYYAVASAEGHDAELYDGISCAEGCDPTSGTAIQVTAGQTTTGIDFFLSAVGCGSLDIQPEELPGGHVGDPYSQQLTASNTSGTVTWSVIDGSLPSGVTLNSSSGLLSGTLDTVGVYQFVIQVVDANSCSVARGYRVEVTGDPTSISLTVFPNPGQNGYPVTLTATVTPSVAPGTVNFSVDGVFVGSAPLFDGVAEIDVMVGLGTHYAVAAYSGGGTYSPSVTPEDPGVEFVIQKGQPPIVWSNPADIVYGTALSSTQLNARVVINEGEDPNDPSDDATLSGTYVYDPPSGTILDAGTQTLSVTFIPDDTENWDNATATVQIVVHKANQTIEWNTPAPIVYGTALSSSQLNAEVSVVGPAEPGALTYNPDFNTILDAGTHTLNVSAAETNNYNAASASVQLIVNKADQTINWSNPADIVYGTALSETQLNAQVDVVGPAPAGVLTYTPPAGTVLNAGTHTLSVDAAETNNYNPASASVTLVVLKATPVFSNLSSPTIIIGTLTTTISGTLSHGAFIPTGNVVITLNGFSQSAAIQANGSFSATFVTGALSTAPAGYPLSFDYAGDANFTPASASSTLYVTYGIAGGPNPPNGSNAGSSIPMRISLRNALGLNLSSPLITVTAVGIRAPGGAFYPVSGNFNFSNGQGGTYTFILHTPSTLSPGVHAFEFTVEDDPVVHSVNFTIK